MKKIFSLIIFGSLLFIAACQSNSSSCSISGESQTCKIKGNKSNGTTSNIWMNASTKAYFDITLDEYKYGTAELLIYDSEDNLVYSDTIIANGKVVVPNDTTDLGYTGEWQIVCKMSEFTGEFKVTTTPYK